MRRAVATGIFLFVMCLTALGQSGEILRAEYGSGNQWADVTERVRSLAASSPRFRVDDGTLGVYSQSQNPKTLRIQVRDSSGYSRELNFRQYERADLTGYASNAGGQNNDVYGGGQLQITSARYGTGFQSVDVTGLLNSAIQNGRLQLRVNSNSMNADPAPGREKWLTVHYTYNGRPAQAVVREGDYLQIPEQTNDVYGPSGAQSDLQITSARYGAWNNSVDVTSQLNSQIRGGELHMQVTSNALGTDPAPGQAKTLTVEYRLNGQSRRVTLREGETLNLPPGSQPDYAGEQSSQTITCESNEDRRTYCSADTRGGVQLVRQISGAPCQQGRTWGADARGIWVSNGCRAEFRVGSAYGAYGGATGAAIVIPAGTDLPVRTNENIDSSQANAGQTFSGQVTEDVRDSSGAVAIPKGSDAQLVIRSTEGSDLVLDVDSITANGQRYRVSTSDLEKKGGAGIGANKRTATMIGGGALAGAIIGAIAGGGKGAAIGAAVGGAGGAGVQVLTRGKQVKVPAETVLTFRLDSDLRLYNQY